jgi:hypothetical protein
LTVGRCDPDEGNGSYSAQIRAAGIDIVVTTGADATNIDARC